MSRTVTRKRGSNFVGNFPFVILERSQSKMMKQRILRHINHAMVKAERAVWSWTGYVAIWMRSA
jgi:hypothetical protein